MPHCSYVVLDHYKSDLVSDSVPCLLLLAVKSNKEIAYFVVFITPIIQTLLDNMSNQHRGWMLEVLFELYNQHKLGHIGDAKFEQFSSLGIGPLRTAAYGTINVADVDEGSILNLVCETIGKQEHEEDSVDPCCLSSFQKLDLDILQQSTLP